MADYYNYDEIYGKEGQTPSVYDPNHPDEREEDLDLEKHLHLLEIEEKKMEQEQKEQREQQKQKQQEQLEQELKESEQRILKRSHTKSGYCSTAYRRDLNVDMMYQLHKKGYSYRRIAKEMGCSPNTVRSRLKYQ